MFNYPILSVSLDPWLHLLEDKEGEKKFDFRLSHSLLQSCEKPLLAGWVFHATPNVSPTPIEIQGNGRFS